MRRVFALAVLACPRSGGRLPVIATVQNPAVVRAVLTHLGAAPGSDSPHAAATVEPSPRGPTVGSEVSQNDDRDGRQSSRLPLPRSRGP